MASIIDGTTYDGYWKLTPDDSSPHAWYLIAKDQIWFDAGNGLIVFISDYSGGAAFFNTTSSTEDGEGNVLATDDEVSTYLSNLR